MFNVQGGHKQCTSAEQQIQYVGYIIKQISTFDYLREHIFKRVPNRKIFQRGPYTRSFLVVMGSPFINGPFSSNLSNLKRPHKPRLQR